MIRAVTFLLAALPLLASGVSGQALCPDTLSVQGCMASKTSGLFPDSVTVEVAKKATSETNVAPASISDFLPRLVAAATTPGIAENLGNLGLVLNTPLNDGMLLDLGSRLQTAIKLNEPKLYSGILDTLREERRPVVKERLEKELDELDDLQLTVTLSPDNRRVGRTARFHVDVLEILTDEVERRAGGRIIQAAGSLMTTFTGAFLPGEECAGLARNVPMRCVRPERRAALEAKMDTLARETEEFVRASMQWNRQVELQRLSDLINNQPQLSLAVDWRPRDVLAGPQSVALRVRGEMGLASMNALRSRCDAPRRQQERQERRRLAPLVTPQCYQQYVGNRNVRSSLRRADRLWLSLDAVRDMEYNAPLLPEDSVTLQLNPKWSLEASGGYGFYVAPGETDPQRTRLDLSARHAWNREAELRPSRRLVLAATLTHRLMDRLALISGLQWANKAEFLDRDVRPVGINFGVRYKFDQGQ